MGRQLNPLGATGRANERAAARHQRRSIGHRQAEGHPGHHPPSGPSVASHPVHGVIITRSRLPLRMPRVTAESF